MAMDIEVNRLMPGSFREMGTVVHKRIPASNYGSVKILIHATRCITLSSFQGCR